MRRWKLALVAAITLAAVGCDVTVPTDDTGGGGGEQCLDDFLADLGKDRSAVEAEAEARGIEASAVITELYEGAVGVADVLFDCSARENMQQLARDSGGTYYEVGNAGRIPDTIIDHNRDVDAETVDIVFLVDATGSMAGEIDAVKRRLREILDALDSPTRVAVASFRDKNVDDPWYDRNQAGLVDASSNGPKGFLADTRATGGGDIAESLYDGVVRTIEQLDWQSEARMVVAITDAPPLTGDGTDHSLDQVIEACAANRVVVVPILVGVN